MNLTDLLIELHNLLDWATVEDGLGHESMCLYYLGRCFEAVSQNLLPHRGLCMALSVIFVNLIHKILSNPTNPLIQETFKHENQTLAARAHHAIGDSVYRSATIDLAFLPRLLLSANLLVCFLFLRSQSMDIVFKIHFLIWGWILVIGVVAAINKEKKP